MGAPSSYKVRRLTDEGSRSVRSAQERRCAAGNTDDRIVPSTSRHKSEKADGSRSPFLVKIRRRVSSPIRIQSRRRPKFGAVQATAASDGVRIYSTVAVVSP